ncbi:MAG: cytochrome c family protein [Thermodesulfobacteriota bacterium]|nr:cytochrome c family protein [Thermodesulfobacteriota bacterium]
MLFTAKIAQAAEAVYVGSKVCAECHEEQYNKFKTYAKKANSSRSVKLMASDLTKEELKECFGCHTTGYGRAGGFKSFEETPELANAGCEVCHGPGSEHVAGEGDTEFIKTTLSIKDCESCHSEERVDAFNFKPMLFGGAH